VFGRKRVPAVDHGADGAEESAPVVDREELVRVASDIIGTQGLLSVTAERLAQELNLPVEQLEADVGDVAAEAYRRLGVAELAEVRRTILSNPSPVQQMRALLSWLATPPEDSDAVRLEAWVLSRRNPALREAVQAGEGAWHGLVASVIRRGARSGDFLQADANDVAAHVISLIDGINAYQLIGYRSDIDRIQLLTRVLQAELGLVWGPELADALS
jgi:AcrR family transcriptional regulator